MRIMVHSTMGRIGILITVLLNHCSGVDYVDMTCEQEYDEPNFSNGWIPTIWFNELGYDDIFLSGQESEHDNLWEDRWYRWYYCRVTNGNNPFSGNARDVTIGATEYDDHFFRGCGGKSALVDVKSWHDSGKEDRSFEFKCKDINDDYRLVQCGWTDWLNSFDERLDYQCPNNGVIRTLQSYHNNYKEDRRFAFECCKLAYNDYEYHKMRREPDSDWAGGWDGKFNVVYDYKWLSGVWSAHANSHEDRRFQWKYVLPADVSLKIATGKKSSGWTGYDTEWTFECDSNEAIIGIESEHSNSREDRRWKFTCGKLPALLFGLSDCGWSGYANNYDGDLKFLCPNHGVVTGIWSRHKNNREDRIFKFKCCQVAKHKLTNPTGQWHRISACVGCSVSSYSVAEGVLPEQLEQSYTQSLETTFQTSYTFNSATDEATHSITIERPLQHGMQTATSTMMSQTYREGYHTARQIGCDKRDLYQWQQSVTNTAGNRQETVNIYFPLFICTDEGRPQCPAGFCANTACIRCTEDFYENYFPECIPSAVTSGFTDPQYNGEWREDGECNGKTAYKHVDNELYLFHGSLFLSKLPVISTRKCQYAIYWYVDGSWVTWPDGVVPGSVKYISCTEGQSVINWSDWYQIHYDNLVMVLCGTLVILCAITFVDRQRQQTPYVVVKHLDTDTDCESECDVEAKPMIP